MLKKRIICFILSLALFLLGAFASFSDIQDESLSEVASLLDALGIMQGVGNGQFSPNTNLTRAQFCKIAMTSLGITSVDAYKNFTIFPDVKNTHWAAAYINAAMRDTSVRDLGIIRGYVDGTFKPDNAVSYGEACTMLLRMLGYTENDVGPFWPTDYISYATSLGITQGVTVSASGDAIDRANAARMLYHSLHASTKVNTRLIDDFIGGTVEGSLLVATSATNTSIASNKAIFYEDGVLVTRSTAQTFAKSDVGSIGTLYLDKSNASSILVMMQRNKNVEQITVQEATEAGFLMASGRTISVGNVKVYNNETGILEVYSVSFEDILPETKVTCVYNDIGQLVLLIR